LLNKCGFVIDAERSMNCASFALDSHLLCCFLRHCPKSTPMPHH